MHSTRENSRTRTATDPAPSADGPSDWYDVSTGKWREYTRLDAMCTVLHPDGHAGILTRRDLTREEREWNRIHKRTPRTTRTGSVSPAWIERQARAPHHVTSQVKATLHAIARGPAIAPDDWKRRTAVLAEHAPFPDDWQEWWQSIDAPNRRRILADINLDDPHDAFTPVESLETPHVNIAAHIVPCKETLPADDERKASWPIFLLMLGGALLLIVAYVVSSVLLLLNVSSAYGRQSGLWWYLMGGATYPFGFDGPSQYDLPWYFGAIELFFTILFFASFLGAWLLFPVFERFGFRVPATYFGVSLILLITDFLFTITQPSWVQDFLVEPGIMLPSQIIAAPDGDYEQTYTTTQELVFLAVALFAIIVFGLAMERRKGNLGSPVHDSPHATAAANHLESCVVSGICGFLVFFWFFVHLPMSGDTNYYYGYELTGYSLMNLAFGFFIAVLCTAICLGLCLILIPGEICIAWQYAHMRCRPRILFTSVVCLVLECAFAYISGMGALGFIS